MKIAKTERFEEMTVVLEQGVDFEESDLRIAQFNQHKKEISSQKLKWIARENGYDEIYFMGHVDPSTKTCIVSFRKALE